MDEDQLNRLVQSRLCRFCGDGDVSPFIVACKCQGSSIHAHCLEEWLSSSKQVKCDVCRHVYQTKLSDRSMWEWYCTASDTSDLAALVQLIVRMSKIVFMLLLSFAFTGLLSDGLGGGKTEPNGKPDQVMRALAWSIMLFAIIRLVAVLYMVHKYATLVWAHWLQWRKDNPRVQIEPNSNLGSQSTSIVSSTVRVAGLRKLLNLKKLVPSSRATNSDKKKD